MKKLIISAALIAGTLFSATSAMAAPHHRDGYTGVNVHQLERRIDQGVRSGKLVRWEERQLRSELRRLERAVNDARRDHRISRYERSRLERKEASLRYHISQLMNNREVVRSSYRNDHRWGNNHSSNNGYRTDSRPAAPTPTSDHRR